MKAEELFEEYGDAISATIEDVNGFVISNETESEEEAFQDFAYQIVEWVAESRNVKIEGDVSEFADKLEENYEIKHFSTNKGGESRIVTET